MPNPCIETDFWRERDNREILREEKRGKRERFEPMIATETQTDHSPRIATCEARLRLAGGHCASISDSGSRYFDWGRDMKIRVADHQNTRTGFWHLEVRVDQTDWESQLDAIINGCRDGVVDMPACVYFADHGAVSQSMLKVFADRRRLYEGFYVTHTQPEKSDTDPMRKGTALHSALLEPDRFERLVVTFPPDMLASNGAVSTKEAKAFRAEHEAAGRVVLKEASAAKVREMADSVRRVCADWFDLDGVRERSVYWINELTGLPCKMRLDWLIHSSQPVLLDLKSTTDVSPDAFRKRIEQNGYWRQEAQYVEGVEEAYGKTPLFYFLAVEDSWPFACSLHELDPESARGARVKRNEELIALAYCQKTGEYSEPWEQRINPVTLSRFCFGTTY